MKKGFSLIELVAVLLLIGVLLLSATVSLVPLADAFLQTRTHADTAQKARLALARLTREFITITNVAAGSSSSITYDFLDPAGASHRHTLSWSGTPGDPLLLEGVALSDDIASFELRYHQGVGGVGQPAWFTGANVMEIVLRTLVAGEGYTNSLTPRNLVMGGGP